MMQGFQQPDEQPVQFVAPTSPVLNNQLLIQLLHYQLLPPASEHVQVLPGNVKQVEVLQLGETGKRYLNIVFKYKYMTG